MDGPPAETGAGRGRAGSLNAALAFNVAGAVLPGLLALVAVPPLARALGPERLGILTLVWTTTGYLALFHFGVGRALTRAASGPAGGGREAADLFATALLLAMSLGAAAGAGLAAAAPALVRAVGVAPALSDEAVAAFRLLGLALPFVVGTPVLTGYLEARLRFGAKNLLGAVGSIVTYVGPLAALALGGGLRAVVAMVVAGRLVGWAALLAACLRGLTRAWVHARPSRRHAGDLLRFGGWITVSGVVSPVMVYMDRYLVGGVLSVAAVAYYGTAQEVMLRVGWISTAVVAVFFPLFAAASMDGGAGLPRLLDRAVRSVAILTFPLLVGAAAFAGEALGWWLGPDYAARGAVVVGWLAAGLALNAFAKVAVVVLEGAGRPDLGARFHLLEVGPYLAALWLLVAWRGIEGAAMAWALRAGVDAALLLSAAVRLYPAARPAVVRAGGIAAATVGAIALARALEPLPARAAVSAAVVAVACAAAARGGIPLPRRRAGVSTARAAGGGRGPAGRR